MLQNLMRVISVAAAVFFILALVIGQSAKSEEWKLEPVISVHEVCEYDDLTECQTYYSGIDYVVVPQKVVDAGKGICEVLVVGTESTGWGDGWFIGYVVLKEGECK